MNKEQKGFHASRRKEFSRLIGKDSVALIFGSAYQNKSYDADFKFKQYKNFYYLTGFTEPNAALCLAPSGINLKDNKLVKEILFVPPKDPLMETWNGKRLGFRNVKNGLGIECGKENSDIGNVLDGRFLTGYRKLYINFAELIKLTGEMESLVSGFLNKLNVIAPETEIIDASYLLGKMRSVKTPYEIKLIRKACEISIKSYNETMKMIAPGVNEYQVEASLEYNYKINGSRENSYPPIVAGGNNACILHYENNDQILYSGDLLLIDSGAEYDYYCSDITRTFPVNGKFSKEQRQIYEIVLKANKECIKKIRPGVKFSALRELSEKVLADGMYKAGLLKKGKDIKDYSLHGIGHHIGLDTHDAVPSGRTRHDFDDILRTGNILTIEPGLYFQQGISGIPKKYWGIGVRIEDDVLVTKSGRENLTGKMMKEVDEIEEYMRVR